jgi:hypothetical protein
MMMMMTSYDTIIAANEDLMMEEDCGGNVEFTIIF